MKETEFDRHLTDTAALVRQWGEKAVCGHCKFFANNYCKCRKIKRKYGITLCWCYINKDL